MKVYRLPAWAAGVAALALAAVLTWQAGYRGAPGLLLLLCLALLLAGYLALGSATVLEVLRGWAEARPARAIVFPLALWAIYAVAALAWAIHSFSALGKVHVNVLGLAFVGVCLAGAFLLLALAGERQPGQPPALFDLLAILWLWLPLEFEASRVTLGFSGGQVHYLVGLLLGLNAALLAFAVWRRLPGIGYRLEWSRAIARAGVSNFLVFGLLAVPLGLALGFIHWTYSAEKWLEVPLWLPLIFLFNALPEEIFFRGLIQNWLELRTRNRRTGLLLAALIFGAAHLNNGPPVPNWKFFLLATLAGVFYGRAWQQTGSLTASALTHTLVNTGWRLFFR